MVQNVSTTNVSFRRGYDIEEDSIDGAPLKSDPEYYDDDGRLKRTGTHINYIFLYTIYHCFFDLKNDYI